MTRQKWCIVQLEADNSHAFVIYCAELLYDKQTEDEQATYSTKYANGVGLNKPDSKFVTAMVKVFRDHNSEVTSLSDAQVEALRNKLYKYVDQLAKYLTECGKETK